MSPPSSNQPENLHRWLSVTLFLIIMLMGMLLLKVLCSKLRPEPNPTPADHLESSAQQPDRYKMEDYDVPASDEVFVIMAGEQSPSCLAKPTVALAAVASATQPCEQV
ncbi:hypothetical protein V6N11_035806 [Hibiscus sabdariffa]|uniref:Uncharacterized protein n=1 Tax=Hibiscus sabdariffa TaxID=183260 RepID=A0ABR2R901_9ROSI